MKLITALTTFLNLNYRTPYASFRLQVTNLSEDLFALFFFEVNLYA